MNKIAIKQMVLTVYSDGTTRCTERKLTERDGKSGRFRGKVVVDKTPMLPGMEIKERKNSNE